MTPIIIMTAIASLYFGINIGICLMIADMDRMNKMKTEWFVYAAYLLLGLVFYFIGKGNE